MIIARFTAQYILYQGHRTLIMRVIPFHRNLPSLSDKKSLSRASKRLPVMLNPSFIQLQGAKEVILNSHSLPLSLQADHPQLLDLIVLASPTCVTAKTSKESCSLPLHILSTGWVQLSFGCELSKIQIRGHGNQNKLNKNSVYSSHGAWKKEHPGEENTLVHVSIEPLIHSLVTKGAREDSAIGNQRKKIGGIVRARFTERANSYSHKQTLASIKNDESIHMPKQPEGADLISNGKKYDSATLNFNSYFQNRAKIAKRTSNTSSSVRSEAIDTKFNKKGNKFMQVPECKPYSPSFFQETNPNFKPRPRFYQQISFTHEQLQLKRKKFQSQFIVKKQQPESVVLKTNESQVAEEIMKCENSRLAHPLQDTFQRGMHHEVKNGGVAQAEESGTLCESVFQ